MIRLDQYSSPLGGDRIRARRVTRRRLLRCSLALTVVLAGSGGRASQAASLRKVSPAEAQYQDRPRNGLSCAACALFRPPGACVVVAGTVSPNGWCRFFDLPD